MPDLKSYYKLGQVLLQIRAAFLLQIGANKYYKLGQLFYYKLGQGLLQIRAGITNWGKVYYKLGQVLQIGANYYKLGHYTIVSSNDQVDS